MSAFETYLKIAGISLNDNSAILPANTPQSKQPFKFT